MSGTVPSLSIIFMTITCVLSIGIPIALLIYLKVIKKADIYPFFVGCAVMLLFALTLEAWVHRIVLYSSAGQVIQNNIWLYALYGGLMAGLFEETGRFLAFRFVLRRNLAKNQNALMYGAGHGGFESIVIVGLTMINNLAWSFMINSGNTASLTGGLSGETLSQVEQGINSLITTPSWQFLMGGLERVFAIVLHIALSVLVWFAVKERDRLYLYPLAILIHFAVDAVGIMLSQLGVNVVLIEVVVAVFTAAAVLIARMVWRSAESEPGV